MIEPERHNGTPAEGKTARLSRSQLLLGADAMSRLEEVKVIVFGTGGVGSWAVEALARTGVRHLTIVDSDCVAPSNINRQMPARTDTVGRLKVEVIKEHIALVNPGAEVTAITTPYTPATAAGFHLESYDYIIDAIDSLSNKAALILHATSLPRVKFFSSMGAALKLDPTRIAVAEFRDVKGCPLARALRNKFKRTGRQPRRKFKCVYSPELLTNRGESDGVEAPGGRWDAAKASTNGSLLHITGIFGFTLAGLVIEDIAQTPLG